MGKESLHSSPDNIPPSNEVVCDRNKALDAEGSNPIDIVDNNTNTVIFNDSDPLIDPDGINKEDVLSRTLIDIYGLPKGLVLDEDGKIRRKNAKLVHSDYIQPSNKEMLAANVLRTVSQVMAERIISKAHVELPDGFLDDYKESVQDGYVPIVITNHASHADAAASSKLLKILIKEANTILPEDDQMEFFTVPLAASLEYGQQGPLLRQVYLGAKPVVERSGFVPNLIVREKDKRPKEEGGYGMRDNTRDYIKRNKEALHGRRNGILIYPEGTTESGKTDEFGVPKGMQPFEEFSIPIHLKLARKHTGRTPVIIYGGIMGSTKAIDPNTKSVSSRAINSFINPSQFHIRVGGLIKTDTPEFEALGTNGELNEYIGKKIAALLHENMRGVYA